MSDWIEILDERALEAFAALTGHFHDGCIKELRYVSGAYVAPNLGMVPLNGRRVLRMIVQCQSKEHPVIELEFAGLKTLTLSPVGTDYTCEISEAVMRMEDGCFSWSDGGDTTVCAEKLRWRMLGADWLGEREFYG